MNEIYLVIKVGVYRHEILGAYINFLDARKNAETAAKEELENHDGYHDFHIESIPLNTAVEDCRLIGYYDCIKGYNEGYPILKDGVVWKTMKRQKRMKSI